MLLTRGENKSGEHDRSRDMPVSVYRVGAVLARACLCRALEVRLGMEMGSLAPRKKEIHGIMEKVAAELTRG